MNELISERAREEEQSDTVLVTKLVKEAVAKSQSQRSGNVEHEAIAQALGQIHGEFSFILFVPSPSSKIESSRASSSQSGYIYYGRD